MPGTHPSRAADRAAVEALRRRLYRPDTTDEDRRRYRRALADPEVPPPIAAQQRPPDRREARPLRVRPVLVGVMLAVSVLTAAPLVQQRLAVEPGPHPVATSAAATAPPVPASAAAPADGYVRGRDPVGVAALDRFLAEHPGDRAAGVLETVRSETLELEGTGAQTHALQPSPAADDGGRMTVILLLARAGAVGWTALRRDARSGLPRAVQQVAARRRQAQSGVPAVDTVRYSGTAPTRFRVAAQDGVRWRAVLVFSR